MAEWKRRTNWAWPDWTYFFGSMVMVPLIDMLLGSPLRWLNSPSGRSGRASWLLEFFVVLVVLNRLDPIGRVLKIPGDAASKTPMSSSAQASVCLWIGVALAVLGAVGGFWVHHLAVASGIGFVLEQDESLFFLLVIALLFSFVCLLTGLMMWLRAKRERLETTRVALR